MIIGYARISSDTQDNAAQLEMIKDYIEERELSENPGDVPIIPDTSSGSVPFDERQGGKQIWETIGRNDILVVQRLDRIGRSLFDLAYVLRELDRRGAVLHVVDSPGGSGPLDTSTLAGRIVIATLCMCAELERELIRTRIAEGKAHAKRQGRAVGTPPFGYKMVEKVIEGKTYKMHAPHDKEQEIIDFILYWKDRGLTCAEVYHKTQEESYRNERSPSGFLGYSTVNKIYNRGRVDP